MKKALALLAGLAMVVPATAQAQTLPQDPMNPSSPSGTSGTISTPSDKSVSPSTGPTGKQYRPKQNVKLEDKTQRTGEKPAENKPSGKQYRLKQAAASS